MSAVPLNLGFSPPRSIFHEQYSQQFPGPGLTYTEISILKTYNYRELVFFHIQAKPVVCQNQIPVRFLTKVNCELWIVCKSTAQK